MPCSESEDMVSPLPSNAINLLTEIEYAAAFFLLADCLKDAINVILNQLKDLQLAIAVTRVYEGESGPVLRELLEEKVLPLAAQEGNRWLASWAFWMLHRRDMAVRALIVSPFRVLTLRPFSNLNAVASLHTPRNSPVSRSPSQALLDRRPCPRRTVFATPPEDFADTSRSIESHSEGGVGFCPA